MPTNGSGLGPRRPPHITVNSGSGGDLLDIIHSDSSQSSVAPDSSRQLTPSRPGTSDSRHGPGNRVYGPPGEAHSSDMLLPPSRARVPRGYQDIPLESPAGSRSQSAMSSRRTSFSSDGGRSRDSRHGPFASPFDDSRAPSRAGSSDDGDINTQTVSEKYNIMPSAGLLLYPEDVEKDDWLHNPDPNEPDREKCDIFTKRGLVNVGGLALITLGILALFVGYPVMYVALCVCRIPYSSY
jgi:beta-glucan synthesis-associated protein KRE6